MQLDGLTAEFGTALSALTPELANGDRLALAVSGGGDSFGMLALAAEALPSRILVLTVDHGLRRESADEANLVISSCRRRNIPARSLKIDWHGEPPVHNRQSAARKARYDALARACNEAGTRWLATAHHLDDQAETLLMRLQRGSGLSGLSGIRPRRPLGELTVLRPCLAMRSRDLHAAAAAAGFAAVQDPSNHDLAYDRTIVRQFLAEHSQFDPVRLAGTAAYLAEAETALRWTAQLAFDGRVSRKGGALQFNAAGLPPEIKRRVVLLVFESLSLSPPRGDSLGRLIARLERGAAATLGGLEARGGTSWAFWREGESGN